MTTVTAVMTKRLHNTVLGVVGLQIVSCISTLLYLLLRCRPLSNYWYPQSPTPSRVLI